MNYFSIPGIELIPKQIPFENILMAVSDVLNIPVKTIMGRSRKQPIVEARFFCYLIMRKQNRMTYSMIASLFGRDHTTVMAGVNAINGYLTSYSHLRTSLSLIKSQL